MYPDQIGYADFGVVTIECLKIHNDNGEFDHYSFGYNNKLQSYAEVCLAINNDYPTIASLLIALGREKFLNAVLEWDPSKQSTKDGFYGYLAYRLNEDNSWDKDDQPTW